MGSSFYDYTADSGTHYQVYLDDAIAAASGFTVPSGALPGLPAGLSLRFALLTYFAGPGGYSLVLPYPTRASLPVALGGSQIIGGTTYIVVALSGESQQIQPGGYPPTPAGPPGPPGPSGASLPVVLGNSTGHAYALTAGVTQLLNTVHLSAGKWLVVGCVGDINATAQGFAECWLQCGSGASCSSIGDARSWVSSGAYSSAQVVAIIDTTGSGGAAITLAVQSSVDATLYDNPHNADAGHPCGIIAVKLQ